MESASSEFAIPSHARRRDVEAEEQLLTFQRLPQD